MLENLNLKEFGPLDWKLIFQIAFLWPEASRFPGTDLLRLVVLHQDPEDHQKLIGQLLEVIPSIGNTKLEIDGSKKWSKTQETNAMFSLRALSNLFGMVKSRRQMQLSKETILQRMVGVAESSSNANVHLSLATLLLNFSVSSVSTVSQSNGSTGEPLLFQAIVDGLTHISDGECQLRLLVAAGNLASAKTLGGEEKKRLCEVLQVASSTDGDEKRKRVHGELQELVQ